MDAQTSWSRSLVGISNPQRLSDSRSWIRQMLYDDWRIAHEEEQFCVEASAVIDGRSEEGCKSRRRGCEPTDQCGGRREGFCAAHRGVLCGTRREGRHQEGTSDAEARGEGECPDPGRRIVRDQGAASPLSIPARTPWPGSIRSDRRYSLSTNALNMNVCRCSTSSTSTSTRSSTRWTTSRGSSSPLTLATTSALWSSRQGRDLVKFHTLERDDEAPQTFYAGVSRHREIDHDSNLYPT